MYLLSVLVYATWPHISHRLEALDVIAHHFLSVCFGAAAHLRMLSLLGSKTVRTSGPDCANPPGHTNITAADAANHLIRTATLAISTLANAYSLVRNAY